MACLSICAEAIGDMSCGEPPAVLAGGGERGGGGRKENVVRRRTGPMPHSVLSLSTMVLLISMLPPLQSSEPEARGQEVTVSILEPFEGEIFNYSRTVNVVLGITRGQSLGEEATLELKVDGKDVSTIEILGEDSEELAERTFTLVQVPNGKHRISLERRHGSRGGHVEVAAANFEVAITVVMGVAQEGEDGTGEFSDGDLEALASNVCEAHGLERRKRPAKIYDCFPIRNELDVLHVRFHGDDHS
jgi:hypothetical protein